MADKRLTCAIIDDDRGGAYKVSMAKEKKFFFVKDLGIRYSLRYIRVFCLTEEREEHWLGSRKGTIIV